MSVESLYASTEPQSTVGDALAQLKRRVDHIVQESIANVEQVHGPNTFWEVEACGHTITPVIGDEGSRYVARYIASVLVLIKFTTQATHD